MPLTSRAPAHRGDRAHRPSAQGGLNLALKLLHESETEDPILSVVNLIDIFLVVIAAQLITIAKNPQMNPFSKKDFTVITDLGKPNIEIAIKNGVSGEH